MTDKHIPASKLLALKDYWDERMGCMTVRSDDILALIDTEPESNLIAELVEVLDVLLTDIDAIRCFENDKGKYEGEDYLRELVNRIKETGK